MYFLLRKSSRLWPLLVIALCAYFAASTVNHLIAATLLAETDSPSNHAWAGPTPPAPSQAPSKDGAPLALRNMFCSACTHEPPPAGMTSPFGGSEPSNGEPPATALPLSLVATLVAEDPRWSAATVSNAESQVQGSYRHGSEIPGAGPIVLVRARFVDFENQQLGRVERLHLLPAPATEQVPTAGPRRTSSAAKGELEGVRPISDTEFMLSRDFVDRVLANPTTFVKGARVVWDTDNGVPSGFKLFAVRPGSPLATIGLTNGDAVRAINGMNISSMDKALEVFTKLRESSNLVVSVQRRGKPLELRYSIR